MFDLTHARHDPAHCLAPGLFRSLKRGDRKKLKLDVTYKYGDNEQIEFKGPEPLGADDLRVLHGLVAMAGPNGVILHPEPQTEVGTQLRLLLEPRWDAVEKDALVIKSSYRKLAREIGYADIDGGKTGRLIRDSIERLWTISIIVQIGKRRQGFHLLAEYASDEADGKLFVALNPRITEAILGQRSYTRIEMDEVRGLKSDPARLIHQRLCGWVDPGSRHSVGMDTLMGYVWPDNVNPASRTFRKRRAAVNKALVELKRITWKVHEYAIAKYHIARPALLETTPRTNGSEPPD